MYKLEQKHVVNGLSKFANEVILQKEASFKNGETTEAGKPQIFIDQLFKKRDVFTNEEISDEVNTIVVTVLSEERLLEVTNQFVYFSRVSRQSATHYQ